MNSMARKISRSMVTPTEIAEISNKTLPLAVSFDDAVSFGVTCYETGMIEVLRGIAQEDMEYGLGCILNTPRMEKDLKLVEEKSEELRQKLDEEELRLLNEFEEALSYSSMSEVEENFIQGFIRGYRYLKNQMKYRGGRNG